MSRSRSFNRPVGYTAPSTTSSPMIAWVPNCFFSFPRSRTYFPRSELLFRPLCILRACSPLPARVFEPPRSYFANMLPLHFPFPSLRPMASRCHRKLEVAGISAEILNTTAETGETVFRWYNNCPLANTSPYIEECKSSTRGPKQSRDRELNMGKWRVIHTPPHHTKIIRTDDKEKRARREKDGQQAWPINSHSKVNATRCSFSKRVVLALNSRNTSDPSSATFTNRTTPRMSLHHRHRIHQLGEKEVVVGPTHT
jgi:hypothetical protein